MRDGTVEHFPGVDGVVGADGAEKLCEERDEEVVGRDDVHEEVVGHLANLKFVSWVFIHVQKGLGYPHARPHSQW